ncbi:helix-hairpin-helix domain-containing protein [Pseudarthrobacter sp. NS4]|uniref:helix-hairpin-helix domain-containing protein n=1 Tax=Pseudarthrobacter sp. NS4 TaxID=2973976 RepID=UPI002163AA1B|nr:helix-hairpin-helix domain-containing protein [Pseudarthrobacter sp. NS4]
MSRRVDGAAGHKARHARDRLQATLGTGPRGLLLEGDGEQAFVYRGPEEPAPPGPEGQSAGHGGGDLESAGVTMSGPALRWRLGLRVAILLGILAITAGAVFWWQTASGRPEILPLGGSGPGSSAAADASVSPDGDAGEVSGQDENVGQPRGAGEPDATGPSPGDSAAGSVVVHVAGAVSAPGVVRLPAGSRLHEAIAAVGGGTPDADLNSLNLALVVEDAQKIHVPRRGEATPGGPEAEGTPGAGAGAGGAAGTRTGSKININTADAAELDALPKVGPVLAQRIVDWRTEHGAFKSIEELDAVDGVGPKMLEALLPLVTV